MLNYVWAELYKLRHKKSFFIGLGLLLVLETLVCVPMLLVSVAAEKQAVMLVTLCWLSLTGLYAAPAFATLAFDDQYSNGTLKNEIVFGVPRRRVYLGKLCAGGVAGSLSSLVVIGWYLLLCVAAAGTMAPTAYWKGLFVQLLGAWLTWLAALSLAFFLMVTIKSGLGAMILVNGINLVLTPIGIAGYTGKPLWLTVLANAFYSAPYGAFWKSAGLYGDGACGIDPLLYALLIGVGWVAATTALGLLVLRRKEIY